MSRRMFCVVLLGIAALPSLVAAQEKLQRDQLLFHLDPAGKVQPVKTMDEWKLRRAAILQAMQSVMGAMPGTEARCDLNVVIDDEVDCGDYVRRLIRYQSEPGTRVPAYLLVPKKLLAGGKPAPGVLSLHPTHGKGFRVTVGLAAYPDAEYGVELAKRGYVVIAPPYPLLSDYNPDLAKLGYQSGTMKAIWDNRRALDVLDSLPFVQKGRHAAIGHSLGGHNSVFTAAFDDRVQVVATCCGLDSYRDYMKGQIKGWTSDRYMPKLWAYQPKLDELPFDFHEIVAAIAPRSVIIVAPKGDTNFGWESAARVAKSAAEVYRLHKADAKLRIEHPDCGHVFSPEMREASYRFIDAALGR